MIRRFFDKQINSVAVAAGLIAISSLISRLLGIFRDRVLAGEFGAGEVLDVYFAAFRVPDLIYNFVVLGALSAGFIPLFSKLLARRDQKSCEVIGGKSHEAAWKFVNNLINIFAIVLGVLGIIGFLFTPDIVSIIAPGFSAANQELTVELTRIMFLSPILLGLSGIVSGVLQTFKRFFVYSLAPIMYNLGIILGALYLVPILGPHGLAWGVVLGAFMHLAIQLPILFKVGFSYKPVIDLKSNNLITLGRMMLPRVLSLASMQINLLVITIIASTLAAGSLSVFNFANNLQSFPIGIFGISFAIAAFPALVENIENDKKTTKLFSKTVRNILFFVIPATVFLLVLRAQIVRVILGTGSFDWNDTVLTMNTLAFFTVSLFAQAIVPFFNRVFYAKKNSKLPFIASFISVGVNIVLSFYLAKTDGVEGLALAFSISAILNFVILWLMLKVKLDDLDEFKILSSVIKLSSAAIGAGVGMQITKTYIGALVDMNTFTGVLAQTSVVCLVGVLIYGFMCMLFKSEEFNYFYKKIKN